MSFSRTLAAIMLADIAGYTAIMHEDEVHAMQYREKLKKRLEEVAANHKGTLIKYSGVKETLFWFDQYLGPVK